jgi:hypothetical protein
MFQCNDDRCGGKFLQHEIWCCPAHARFVTGLIFELISAQNWASTSTLLTSEGTLLIVSDNLRAHWRPNTSTLPFLIQPYSDNEKHKEVEFNYMEGVPAEQCKVSSIRVNYRMTSQLGHTTQRPGVGSCKVWPEIWGRIISLYEGTCWIYICRQEHLLRQYKWKTFIGRIHKQKYM